MLIHGSTLAFKGHGLLIRGSSASGKSDLALHLIDDGALLVADDQTELYRGEDRLMARAPAPLQGLLEVRHIGIVRLPFLSECSLSLIIDLEPDTTLLERYPKPETTTLLEIVLPRYKLPAYDPSLALKIKTLLMYQAYDDRT